MQQIIAGLSEGVILIEPRGRILWANEAALKMHGVADLDGLGGDAGGYRKRFKLRYRNNHPVRAGHYPIDRVLAGEAFGELVVTVRPAADREACWVHRIRGLVLVDAAGETEYLALILADATEWANAEERFEKTFASNPAPSLICRLGDLRYVKVNQGFLDMTGYTREQVIDRSVYELDVLEAAEQRELAVQRLAEGATIPQMQAELPLPGGGSKLVVVAGQPLEVGERSCMLLTFIDLEPRRQAENMLRRSEERFAKAFRTTPVPTLVVAAEDGCVMEANDAFVATTGRPAESVRGRGLDELALFERPQEGKSIGAVLAESGRLQAAEHRVRRADGGVLDCLVAAETVAIQGRDCYLLTWQDITDRKRTELELVRAIEEVMQDASWFSQSLLEKLASVRRSDAAGDPRGALADLTPRERDILALICEGLADKVIASRLAVSPNTVRNHVAALYAKLGVHSRGEAIVWAQERGLLGRAAGQGRGRRR